MPTTQRETKTMSTKEKAAKIARDFQTLQDRGLSAKQAIERIAGDSGVGPETIAGALLYAAAR
jgi:hypothetical protein